MSDKGYCPECGDQDGEIGTVCESCHEGVVEEMSPELQELMLQFDQPPMVVIGEGRKRATEVAEYVDADEANYNRKYGLDKEGNPLASDKLMERVEDTYGATLSEGFGILEGEGDYDDAASPMDVMSVKGLFADEW